MDSMVYAAEDDDSEGLWDELNHRQSQEAWQHHQRQQQQQRNNGFFFFFSTAQARRLAQQSVEELRRVGSVVYQAAAASWNESADRQRRRRRRRQNNNNIPPAEAFRRHDAYLEEFGIRLPNSSEQQQHDDVDFYTSLEEQQQRQHDNNNTTDDYIFLPSSWRRRWQTSPHHDHQAAASSSLSIANLDLYFQSLYTYYYHRGLTPIVAKGVVELVTLAFTLVLTIFLFAYVDWRKLAQCTDETTCQADFVQAYIQTRPFASLTIWNVLVILYAALFCLYSAFASLQFWHVVQQALRAKWVYEERLGISARKLLGGAVDWDGDVVAKLVALQNSGEYRVAIHNYAGQQRQQQQEGDGLDALVIANRIMRKENFMVALFNRRLLDLTVPWVAAGEPFFCSSLEWSIYFCVLNFMFNHKYQIRPAFYLDPAALRRRFQLCGIAHVVFMPFLLFFVTMYFGLQNVYDWKSTKQYLGPREWSLPAKWTFRGFNELPHLFERRLAPSYKAAETYLGLFGSNEIVAALGRIFVFIGGSLSAVLIGLAAMNDAILLHVKIADWNLLWYAGIFGVLYSGGKSMIPDAAAQPKSARNLFAEIDEALAEVATHTHYYPETWKGRGWDQTTHKQFSSMFMYKARLFVKELVSLVLAPYILCVSLAKCSEQICEFVVATRTEILGAGEVCGYATFDFDKFCDETWDGRTIGNNDEPMAGSLAESIMQMGNVDEATRRFPKPKARLGKMEKSFFSFKEAHPSWKCSESGQTLVERVEQRQREEMAALQREQDLHREAAARQLETLAELEEGRRRSDVNNNAIGTIDEEYIPMQAPADAGAGNVRRD